MTRVLWLSNAPWAASGYGQQTGLFCHYLSKLGHEIAVLANYGIRGTTLEVEGIRVYPAGMDRHGNDVVQACADDWGADVIISLYDAWPLNFASLAIHKTSWVAWAPVDHEEVPPGVAASLRRAQGVVSFSGHGVEALNKAGIQAEYIPHGINTGIFNPGDQAEARGRVGFPNDKFIVGMVAANNYSPSRKCIPEAIVSFARLHDQYPNTMLYLHMLSSEAIEGVNVIGIINSLGLAGAVSICDQFQYIQGHPAPYMADLYRSLDVLLNPSRGEGFGIPIVEAEACGTPVIATDGTAMTELVERTGWLVPGQPWWSGQGAWQVLPMVDRIVYSLIEAYQEKMSPVSWVSGTLWQDRRNRCVNSARRFDYETMVAPAWDEYLQRAPWLPVESKP